MAGSMYGLLGLLIAFTFGMSGDRFKARKAVIVEEANNISTAVLRIQLYADSVQPLFKENFHHYLKARIKYYEAQDFSGIEKSFRDSDHYADQLWKIATKNSKISANLVASNQMVPALNAMFDITQTRFWGEFNRTPDSILIMLFLLSMSTAFVAGYTSVGRKKFDWSLAVGFCLLTSLVIFFILDLDKPRRGLITLDQNEKAIVDLLKMLE